MMDWVRRNPLLAVLAGIAIVLAAVIAAEAAFSPDHAAAATTRKATPAESKLLPPLAAILAEQAYPETAARPLFSPTRRPAPEAPAAEKNGFQKGQYQLLGVIAVGNNRTAMLREKSTGKVINVERGKEIKELNGVKVAEIEPDTVTLALGTDREELKLAVQRPPNTPGAAAAMPMAPTGPFAPPPGAAPPQGTPPPPQGMPVPGQPFVPPTPLPPGGAPAANPIGRPASTETTAPLTPEELLARRRARRAAGQPAQ